MCTSRVPEDIWARAEATPGWFHREEADCLWALNALPTAGSWCELGSYNGRSTIVLASGQRAGWAVDTFEDGTYPEFKRRTEGLEMTVLADDLAAVADKVKRLHLLHLDAGHTYAETRFAFETYGPKVLVGGYAAFHDAYPDPVTGSWPGVEQYVAELRAEPSGWLFHSRVARLAVFWRHA